jgi:hypothetical protein
VRIHKLASALTVLSAVLPAADGVIPNPKPVANGKLIQFVQERAKKLRPAAAEKRWDEVGWAASLVEARRLAREHRRPLFVFTHAGNVATGRC